MSTIVVVLSACVVAVVVALLWMCRQLISARTQLAQVSRADEIAAEKERVIDVQVKRLESQFAKLAADELLKKQDALSSANNKDIGNLLEGFKAQLKEYENEVKSVKDTTVKSATSMEGNVKLLNEFAIRASEFTAALLGGNKIQGNQGEFILSNILEQSGLRAGCEYDSQIGKSDDDGRPDICVYDALNKYVIYIDAKMNIKDFVDAYNLPDDTVENRQMKKKALSKHVTSIKNQIKKLSEKRYAESLTPARVGYVNLPLVAMFCPFNAVLEAALSEEPTLMQFAAEKNVVLVTPTTIWGYLCLISAGWKRVESEKKYEDIQALGGKVIEKVNELLGDIEQISIALENAVKNCEQLKKRAGDKGQLSIKRAAKELLDYGCVTKKEPKHVKQVEQNGDEE